MYRKILSDLGVTSDRYDALMNRYVAKAQLYPNRKEKAAARASLSKELLKEFMTWKTLVKGIMFLAVPKFDFTIRLYHASGKVTEHSLTVVLDEDTEESEEVATVCYAVIMAADMAHFLHH
jgi:hypothetical protein